MTKDAHPQTLFHLVPANQVAHDALRHPDNKRFVSSSVKGPLGLEVGYHVPPTPQGHVITRLGRNTHLILHQSSPGNPMSAVHVAFEVNPATELVVLSVRSKRTSTVRFAVHKSDGQRNFLKKDNSAPTIPGGDVTGEQITGGGVILYRQDYELTIASYNFYLFWRTDDAAFLKALVLQGYQTSLRRLKDVRSRDRPTEGDDSEALSWHVTRLDTVKGAHFRDFSHLRQYHGHGTYGTVYKAIDQTSGHLFAIKVVKLDEYRNVDEARAILHREIKVMEGLNHAHIIEYLGHQHFNTLRPEIFMPLRDGSLTSFVKEHSIPNPDQFCMDVLEQMLSALDHLASKNLVHRDVKPDNILYYALPNKGGYHFQLADFGLANHSSLAKTFCGTGYYQAPELWPGKSNVYARQTPKMDVWSLFATIVAVHCRFQGFPPDTSDYSIVLSALKDKASGSSLQAMARVHPDGRASAAQILVYRFDGRGLSTPRAKILPIEPEESLLPTAGPNRSPQTRTRDGKAPRQPEAAEPPLVVYPPRRGSRRHRISPPGPSSARRPPEMMARRGNPAQAAPPQMQSIRTHRDGVAKRRAEPTAGRAGVFARPPADRARLVAEARRGKAPRMPGEFVD